MIGIYQDKLMYSPLDFPSFRVKAEKKYKVTVLKHHVRAQIIASSYLNILEKYIKKYGSTKKYLLWTHEPYHDWNTKREKKIKGITVRIMNVYTGDVFLHNFRYFYFRTPIPEIEIHQGDSIRLICQQNPKGKPIVALSTYYPMSYYHKNPYTLLPIRYNLIEIGYQMGILDVHGKNWDKHPIVQAIGNTRNVGDRRESKQEILQDHHFNLCVENADVPYYVTEKIWEPIKYGCLPIYYSNSTIYEIFPRSSFIDVRDFETSEKLYEYLQKMTVKEYKERYNLCVQGFNSVIEKGLNTSWRGKSKNQNINYLEYKSCFDPMMKRITQL